MSDSDRLRDRIARLREDLDPDGTGWRRLRGDDAGELADLVLREIAETVMHRRLLLDTGADAPLVIEAAGGRVLALQVGSRRLTGRGEHARSGIDRFAARLAAALDKALSGRTGVRIRSARPRGRPEADDLRCPPERIARYLGPARLSGREGLSALLSALDDAVHGWVLLDPAGRVISGSDRDDRAGLPDDLATGDPAARNAQLDAAFGDAGAEGWAVLGPAGPGRALLVARSRDIQLLAIVRQAVVDDLARHWRKIMGG